MGPIAERIALGVMLAWLPVGHVFAAPPAPEPKVAPAEERVCVPPGLPPFSTWRRGPVEPIISVDEWGRPVIIVMVNYLAQGRKLRTFWVGSLLALVDDAPDNPAELVWQDTGVVAADMAPRTAPAQSCRWVKPPPKPMPEKET